VIGLARALWALALAALVTLAAETWLLVDSSQADRGLWIALLIVVGGGFIGAGLFAWYRRPDNRTGALMVATGFAWCLCVLARSDVPLLFSLGLVFSNLFVATAIHLLLAFPSGRLAKRRDRWLVGLAYGLTTVGTLPMALSLKTEGKAACEGCPDNVFAIGGIGDFAEVWVYVLGIGGVAILLAVLGRLIGRWLAATPPMRRVITPVFAAGALLLGLLSLVLLGDLTRIDTEITNAVYYATLVPFGLVPYLFLGGLARARMLRGGAVGELLTEIGEVGRVTCLRDALARALNDPSLELAYWLPDSQMHVDSDGRRVELPKPGSGRATYDVAVEGEQIAVLIHDPLLSDEPELIVAVGGAAALALGRERLDAELRAKVGELRESRARLLSIGLAERRRLERDLHDGAQQRLVSLALDLRLARDAVHKDPEQAQRLLDGAGDELELALGELRELARGLHPAVLSDRGLDPAIETLAGRAPLPVEVAERLGDRAPEPVELAAYFVVSEALTNIVKYADASRAVIRVGRENGSVRVSVSDDGVGGANAVRGTGLSGLGERIAALGGRLEVNSPEGVGTTVIARIPCE
jgi:signal transduction histidine kinase